MKEKFIEMFGNFVDFQEIEGVYWEIREHLDYVIKNKYKIFKTKDVLGYKYTIYIDNIRKELKEVVDGLFDFICYQNKFIYKNNDNNYVMISFSKDNCGFLIDVIGKENVTNDYKSEKEEEKYVEKDIVKLAVISDNIDIVKQICELNYPINLKDNYGFIPLHVAITKGNNEIIKYLINKGKELINITTKSGFTALHFACLNTNFEIVKILIENGVDINAVDEHNNTPLSLAIGRQNIEIISFLLNNNCNINSGGEYFHKGFNRACLTGNVEIVKVFKNYTKDINEKDWDSYGAIHNAIITDSTEVVKYLIENNIDLHSKNEEGEEPLQMAERYERKEIVKVIKAALKEEKKKKKL